MARNTTFSIGLGSLLILFVAGGAGLNTDVALTPPMDGWILRAQWRYSRLIDDPTPLDRDVHRSAQPITLAYGATAKLAILGTVPIIYR